MRALCRHGRTGGDGEGRKENKKYSSIQPLTPNIDQDRPGFLSEGEGKARGLVGAGHVSRSKGTHIKKVK